MSVKREPAMLLLALLVPTVQAVVGLGLTDSPELAGLINACAVALAGALTAAAVKSENLLPMIVGAAQAVLALIVGLGVGWTPEQQALLLAPIAIVAGFIVRGQVDAPEPKQTVAA
ncbi:MULTISPECIES: hypothetical protein [Pseudonocardia]|uniref:Uncharacterized protein n=2 Tax=Pseudonocardia TaxID=1847 RepID=A0A1Y2N639_PSEAH|nr:MULTISPECIES: hypothetical protein [Pseudonocardia]OSY42932.1 hypothetical protein BG845_01174 [Pseudonocardia autotrophica]TDN77508.1 hypothetical protein C8E95_6756 [Pseudonocardia autotrophica]BBG01533.1 hypothetical protein Pdca_27420 [Pseudonocardia autotrophica]GEC25317.1 hypothetical protein PSA01_23460 [Pseudonocardia saturnea]